ncbi:MAG: metallophosphoesterase [Candidatus Lokiarchaeota archaeon]|nr:metallophosphoesterase [Candidatus Lokiarchaeota archaeon]
MKTEISEQKQVILKKLVNSGINISPKMLECVLNLENPIKSINILIKETSFIPSFKSHLTETIVHEISNEELQKTLKRALSKSLSLPLKEGADSKITVTLNESIPENFKQEIDPIKVEQIIETSIPEEINHVIPNSSLTKNTQSIKKKAKIHESTKSVFKFRPAAKEYDSQFEILSDPTGKLYTNGGYDDFYELTLDKYNKLRNLMRKRPEASSATNINNIYRLSNSVEISTVGLVEKVHETKKGNFLLSLEDLTGKISVLIQNNSKNLEYVNIIERTFNDQMLFVKGLYNPGENGRKGIIFANHISKIDIPTDFKPNVSPDPLSIALISDTHIGSKEFEEELFKKFLKFLNGKSSNKINRENAGRIKYLVINGDLIDGVGIYPNQKEDLIVSDIFDQFKKASELLSEIPDYIKVFYVSGNHEPVRNAIPRPAVPNKYCEDIINLGIKCLGNPSLIKTHNVNTLIFHGESMHDVNRLIHDLDINKPIETMKEFLICRHLAPVFGEKTQIAPISNDMLVLNKIPDIFHTGHIHINGMGRYRNVTLVNSGCFQAQTDFMRSFGIIPTPGIVPIIELDSLNYYQLDFKKID